jgi:hypothetical protein
MKIVQHIGFTTSCAFRRKLLIWLFLFAFAAERMSAQSAQSIGDEFFEKKIRPVLASNCYGCHSSKLKTPMGGLALDTKAGLLKGGDSGPAIVPGKPAESLLLRAMRYNDMRLKMPPTDKLPDAVIADFEQWIAAGAHDPRTEAVIATSASKAHGIDFDKGRQWWSFQPVRELPAPRVKQVVWPRAKTDRFILAKLEKNGLKPSAEADPRTLIRRAYLDLTGLKPSYEEVESFANDKDQKRYEKLIDRLLASPRYGERWGRYWLAVARYAENGDTGGNRQAYPYAWRYRDWVIEAFNHDLPYDRFLKQQLAADLMPGASRNDLRALGYLGMAPSEWKEKMLGKDLIDNLLLEEWDERVILNWPQPWPGSARPRKTATTPARTRKRTTRERRSSTRCLTRGCGRTGRFRTSLRSSQNRARRATCRSSHAAVPRRPARSRLDAF